MQDLLGDSEGTAAPTPDTGESSGDAPLRRASTFMAVGVMALVAVVSATGVVLIMRFAPAATPDAPRVSGFEDTVPATLIDGIAIGEVPAAVAAAVDVPVVGARRLDALPEGVDGCFGMFAPGQDVELEEVIATPDVLTISTVGENPEQMGFDGPFPMDAPFEEDGIGAPRPGLQGGGEQWRETCTFVHSRGAWSSLGSSGGPVENDMGMGMGMGAGFSCCDAEGFGLASTSVQGPSGATWALQERGAYWLAYPVEDGQALPLTLRTRESGFGGGRSSTHLLWVDDEGTVFDEQFLSL